MRTGGILLIVLAAACGGGSTPPAASRREPASTVARRNVQEDLSWLVGRWESPRGIEHWVAAGDALFGASFTVEGGRTVEWEALIIKANDDGVVYEAAPGGAAPTAFRQRAPGRARFDNPENDFPGLITYLRSDGRLDVWLGRANQHNVRKLSWTLAGPGSAPELEAADRAWSDEVGRRGVDAWVENFDPEGVQRGNREPRIVGADAIRKAMEPVLAGSFRLVWEPIASGLSPAGDLGYTIGRWVYRAGNVDQARGGYITLWRRQPDGRWKVLYDAGDPENK